CWDTFGGPGILAGLVSVPAPAWAGGAPRGGGVGGGGGVAGARPVGAPDTSQFLRGVGDGMPEDVLGVGVLTLVSGTAGPRAAAQSRGISSAGGGGMGVCVHDSSA